MNSSSSLFRLLLANKMDPPSSPYAGGGAMVPWIGARPHFFTFASTNTNPTSNDGININDLQMFM